MTSAANQRQAGGDHYRTQGTQHWDLMADYNVPYLEGNSSKYGYRWPKKNGLEDVEKFQHYVEKILEKHREEDYVNVGQMTPEAWMAFCITNGVDEVSAHATLLALTWQNEEQLLQCLALVPQLKEQAYSK